MIILGIETSCDETGVAICEDYKILSSHNKTQHIHKEYGGVVPEIASREHEKFLPIILKKVFDESGLYYSDLDAIAVTNGPGLMGSLLSGVSGGHTQLWMVKSNFEYELLGETLDDACGEAFDKGAKTLGLNYPGGPEIEKFSKEGNKDLIEFPRPMINDKSYNFSFSGLKTSLINYIKNNREYDLSDVAASYQEAIVDTLAFKLDYAMKNFKINTGIICGGVAANSRLRDKLNELNKEILFPSLKYCTDNADMIAFLAMKKAENKDIKKSMDFSAYSRGITL